VTLDPQTHAVRSDLADVRLAAYVFAPHYAAPVTYRLVAASVVSAKRNGADVLGEAAEGASFEVLDLVADRAWGMAPGIGKAGWIDRSALGAPASGSEPLGSAGLGSAI